MTDDKQQEKWRLERLQLHNFKDRRAGSVQKAHDRLEKLKKLAKHEEMK